MSLSPAQSRAARGLLEWSQPELALAARLAVEVVRGFEGRTSVPTSGDLAALRAALEGAGVQFVDSGQIAAGPGVALGDAGDGEGLRPAELNAENDG